MVIGLEEDSKVISTEQEIKINGLLLLLLWPWNHCSEWIMEIVKPFSPMLLGKFYVHIHGLSLQTEKV